VNEALWTVRDVAAYLGVPAKTIYTWRCQGIGPPGFRVGKHVRFRPSEVEEWLEEHREEESRYVSGPRGRWGATRPTGA